MSEVKKLLDTKLESAIVDLDSIQDQDELSVAVDNVVKLHNMRIEEEKIRQEDVKLEQEEKRKNERMLDRILTFTATMGVAIGGWVTYDAWQKRGLIFEQTGSDVSPWVKNLITKALPK